MTYQELIYKISKDTVAFITDETSKTSLDPTIVMELISKTILEINYNTIVNSLDDGDVSKIEDASDHKV